MVVLQPLKACLITPLWRCMKPASLPTPSFPYPADQLDHTPILPQILQVNPAPPSPPAIRPSLHLPSHTPCQRPSRTRLKAPKSCRFQSSNSSPPSAHKNAERWIEPKISSCLLANFAPGSPQPSILTLLTSSNLSRNLPNGSCASQPRTNHYFSRRPPWC